MHVARRVILAMYLFGAAFLITGHAFKRDAVPILGAPFMGPWTDRAHVTIWTPPYKQFELATLPAGDSRPTGRDLDDTPVRPAWGVLAALVIFFLYIWANTEHGDVLIFDVSWLF